LKIEKPFMGCGDRDSTLQRAFVVQRQPDGFPDGSDLCLSLAISRRVVDAAETVGDTFLEQVSTRSM